MDITFFHFNLIMVALVGGQASLMWGGEALLPMGLHFEDWT